MISLRRSLLGVVACACALVPAATATADPLGELVFSPDAALVFGAVTSGQSSTQTVTLKNNASSDDVTILGLSLAGPDAGEFSIVGNGCPPVLGPGSGCDVDVAFSPTHVGSAKAELVADNDGLNQPLVRELLGDGVAPSLSLSSTAIDFGTVWVSDGGQSHWVQVQNDGVAPARVDQVDIDGPGGSAFWIDGSNCQGQTLGVGGNCSFYVRFGPQDDQTYDATLHVRSAGSDFSASITGVGGISDVTMSPAVVEFGGVDVGAASTATVTMRSSGNLPYQPFVTIFNGGDVGSFRILKDGCSLQLLMPDDECTLVLRFAPYEAGPVQATLAVLGNGEPKVVTARGEGLLPAGEAKDAGSDGRPVAAADAARAASSAPESRAARIAFGGRRSPTARYRSGWVYVGRARCDGAARCRVVVRTQYVVTFGDEARPYLVRGRTRTLTVGAGRRVWAPLPRHLHGKPARVLLTLETQAAGLPSGLQYEDLRLLPARR